MLFDPAKSADPPIKTFSFLVNAVNVSSEAFLEAIPLRSFTASIFSFFSAFKKLFFKIFLIIIFFFG